MGLEHTEVDFVPFEVTPPPPGPWLVFAAHADDETLGMGGLLLLAREKGEEVHLVVVTDGAAGGGDAAALRAVREQEAREVAGRLGLAGVSFWRQRDRMLAPSAALAARVAARVAEVNPQAVFFPSIMEYHPDHRATAALVWQGLELHGYAGLRCAYEISCQSRINRLVDISPVRSGKRALIAVYASQTGQNDYLAVSEALNRSRIFSLPAGVEAAEGLYVYAAGTPLARPVQELAGLCDPGPPKPGFWRRLLLLFRRRQGERAG